MLNKFVNLYFSVFFMFCVGIYIVNIVNESLVYWPLHQFVASFVRLYKASQFF